jgi:hypothetical protein
MLSTRKTIQGMRQLFSGLTWGLLVIASTLASVDARAFTAIGVSTEQDVLPDGRLYVLRYTEHALTTRQDLTIGLSVKAIPSADSQALPIFNASGLDAGTLRLDARSQYLLDPHALSTQLTYLRQNPANALTTLAPSRTVTDWAATSTLSDAAEMINTLRKKFSYVYQGQFGASVAFFQRSGTTYELFWTPTQHVRVGTQYTASRKLNETSPNPGNNNTWFCYVGLTY